MQFIELLKVVPIGISFECLEKQRSEKFLELLPLEDQKEKDAPEPAIVCRQCRNHITDENQRLSMDGANQHTYANPHGHVYDIVLFGSAPGCQRIGPSSDEFTWFKGYAWQIVICAGCMTHLGWFFISSEGHHFFGLIVDRLISTF